MDLDIAVKLVISLVVIGVVAAVGVRILAGVYTNSVTANASPTALTAINDSISGIGTVTNWLPLVALVFVAVIILSAVFIIRRVSS